MDMSNMTNLDSNILLGIVNEKLRIECNSFDELITVYEVDVDNLIGKLSTIGYQYDPLTNQFKNCDR